MSNRMPDSEDTFSSPLLKHCDTPMGNRSIEDGSTFMKV